MQRRLAAILVADVVGYSRLMGADEAGTLHRLKEIRQSQIDPLLAARGGRIVKLVGDGAVVEFASVVDAVDCAVVVQEAMARGDGSAVGGQPLRFRIAVHLGDLMVDGDDVYGEGINVAARLEALAEPGGIVVSETVREHVGTRLDLVFEDLGPHELKNIDRPVRVHRVARRAAREAAPALRASTDTKPSVAVLPFVNLSGDLDQEYFSEGITEDLITDLSKISGLLVAGRRSAYGARQTFDAAEARAQLRVGHVLEGSVRRAGSRIRVTARLVDGATGAQVWAERYDRTLDDIFAVQDDITYEIVAALKLNLLPTEREAIARTPTTSLEAYGDYTRGLKLLAHPAKSSLTRARRMFTQAVELDPNFARALAGIAECDCSLYIVCGEAISFEDVLATASRALHLEPGLASAHTSLGTALFASGRIEEAEQSFQQAIAAEPDFASAHYFYGRACAMLGRNQDAVKLLRRAADLAPYDVGLLSLLPCLYVALGMRAEAEATAREALARCQRELEQEPDHTVAAWTGAGAAAFIGERKLALTWAKRALAIEPDDHLALYNVACAYALLGLLEESIDILERAMPGAAAHRIAWMRRDSDLGALRDHPRYVTLLRQLDRTN